MKFLQELTGSFGQFTMWLSVISGVAMYKYNFFKEYILMFLPEKFFSRKILFNTHKAGVLLFAIFIIIHYLTTKKNNLFLIYGALISILAVILIGFMFRFKKYFITLYHKLVYTKVSIFIIGTILVWIGHLLADD